MIFPLKQSTCRGFPIATFDVWRVASKTWRISCNLWVDWHSIFWTGRIWKWRVHLLYHLTALFTRIPMLIHHPTHGPSPLHCSIFAASILRFGEWFIPINPSLHLWHMCKWAVHINKTYIIYIYRYSNLQDRLQMRICTHVYVYIYKDKYIYT